MPSRHRMLLAILVAWTVFLWVQRLLNAWSGDESTAAKVTSTVLATVFLAFAGAGVWLLVRHRRRPLDAVGARILVAFAAWTTVVWTVRVGAMVVADHSVAFKVVHAALGVISVGLAVTVARPVLRRWSPQPLGS